MSLKVIIHGACVRMCVRVRAHVRVCCVHVCVCVLACVCVCVRVLVCVCVVCMCVCVCARVRVCCVHVCVCVRVDNYMHGQEPTSCGVKNGTSQVPCHVCMMHSRLLFPLLMRMGGSND